MNPNMSDETMRELLAQARVIAVVGHSDKPDRTSYQIAQFLRQVGYVVYPVNPNVAEINGLPSYSTLSAVPEPIDVVNVFRRSDYLLAVVEEAIAINAKTVWAQLGISNPQAAARAAESGLNLVMDACIKIEHQRLLR